MTAKAITKEQIDALPRYFGDSHDGCRHIGYLTEDNQGTAVLLDDLRALYDNAPCVGDSEPYAYAVDGNVEQLLFFDKQSAELASEINCGTVLELYPNQQPDRVAELEAKLKKYEADAKRYKYLESIVSFQEERDMGQGGRYWLALVLNDRYKNGKKITFNEAIDQAMKGT